MKTKQKIGTALPESWFIERIGKRIKAESDHAFNGDMEITDENHAKYLCHTGQKHIGYRFYELSPPQIV